MQIADPHLGPWQPVAKLRRVIDDLLRHDPDLVLLTGDFLTMEGSGTRGALAEALAPLRARRGTRLSPSSATTTTTAARPTRSGPRSPPTASAS